MRDVGEWSLSFPLARTSAVVKLCQHSSSAHGCPKILLLFADILRRKINFWALPNSKKLAFSLPLPLSFSLSFLIMSRRRAALLMVLSGLWCACLQVEKWTAVSKAWLLFQAQVLALAQTLQFILFLLWMQLCQKSSCLKDWDWKKRYRILQSSICLLLCCNLTRHLWIPWCRKHGWNHRNLTWKWNLWSIQFVLRRQIFWAPRRNF